eukprot:scaffold2868_cov113-Skeletonema_menzelii.AAC.2
MPDHLQTLIVSWSPSSNSGDEVYVFPDGVILVPRVWLVGDSARDDELKQLGGLQRENATSEEDLVAMSEWNT